MDKTNSAIPAMAEEAKGVVKGVVLALDVGAARIGVARASTVAGLASPLTHLDNSPQVIDDIKQLVAREQAVALVVGLPRNLQGQDTDQTRAVREFAAQLKSQPAAQLGLPMFWQDEALTSKQAEAELAAKGKPFSKGDVDAVAACYILQDFLNTDADQRVAI